jgi:hypothetical protein
MADYEKKAREIVENLFPPYADVGPEEAVQLNIAKVATALKKAVEAETERCVKIAENHTALNDGCDGIDIAAAIRSSKTETDR